MSYGKSPQQVVDFLQGVDSSRGWSTWREHHPLSGWLLPGAMVVLASVCNSPADGHAHVPMKILVRICASSLPDFLPRSGVPIIAGRDFNDSDGQKNRSRRDCQSDSRAAHVPQSGCHQSPCLLDRSRAAIRPWDPRRTAPHHRRHRRILTICMSLPESMSPFTPLFKKVPFWRAPFHSHRCESLFSRCAGHPDYSRHFRRSAYRACCHPRRRPRGSAHARPFELTGLRRVRGCRVGHCIGWRRGRAGFLGQRADARIRHPPALGSQPQNLLKGVIAEGAVMAAAGVLAGAALGFVAARLAGSYFLDVRCRAPCP